MLYILTSLLFHLSWNFICGGLFHISDGNIFLQISSQSCFEGFVNVDSEHFGNSVEKINFFSDLNKLFKQGVIVGLF